jgi:hypothetical protein
MRTAPADRLTDLVAVYTAAQVSPEGFRDSDVEAAVDAAIDDVSTGNAFDVALAAFGILGVLLDEVASATGESRDDVLRRIALRCATNLPKDTDDIST